MRLSRACIHPVRFKSVVFASAGGKLLYSCYDSCALVTQAAWT